MCAVAAIYICRDALKSARVLNDTYTDFPELESLETRKYTTTSNPKQLFRINIIDLPTELLGQFNWFD